MSDDEQVAAGVGETSPAAEPVKRVSLNRRHTISLNGETYRRIKAYAKSVHRSVSGVIDDILEPSLSKVLGSRFEWPGAQFVRPVAPARFARASAGPRPVPDPMKVKPPPVAELLISAELAEAIDDQIERAQIAGVSIGPSQMLDRALNQMLDHVEGLPPSRFCHRCTDDIDGDARRLPIGRNGELVQVCRGCDIDHPRNGRRIPR